MCWKEKNKNLFLYLDRFNLFYGISLIGLFFMNDLNPALHL